MANFLTLDLSKCLVKMVRIGIVYGTPQCHIFNKKKIMEFQSFE
jgi:hypothetical protein